MAILQISRITNRKGLQENVPQLAGAELGWAVDSRRLYIGNGTLQEGAPVVGNTEILTEFSDITVLSDYTYEDIAVGYAVQTGPTTSDPVVRTVQEKLDDQASIRDFGAVGDGITDDTLAINRALFQLYCRETNTAIRRSLFFPAGTYRVTETIIIPPYAKLKGEGADSSVILLDTSSDISTLNAYVARFGDSLQQTGANIGSGGATPPQNIEISSMGFQSLEVTDVFGIEDANQCWFDSVNFIGPIAQGLLTDPGFNPADYNIAGVRFASTSALPCQNITFDKCAFLNLTWGIKTDQTVLGTTVSNSRFWVLYRGIELDDNVSGFRAVHNQFDRIFAQGIIYDNVNLNVSAYNVFYNVGNSIGSANPTTAVIQFGNDNNVSIGDMFQRSDVLATIEPRIAITGSSSATGGTLLQVGRYARQNGRTFTLIDGVSNQPIFTVNALDVRAFRIDYTIVRSTLIRHGTMMVASGGSSTYSDDFVESASTGITLSTTQSGDTVTVRYSATSLGFNGVLTYSVAHLA